jgi:hypothetical protein
VNLSSDEMPVFQCLFSAEIVRRRYGGNRRDEKYPMLGSPLPFTIGLLFVPHSQSAVRGCVGDYAHIENLPCMLWRNLVNEGLSTGVAVTLLFAARLADVTASVIVKSSLFWRIAAPAAR